MIHCLKVHIEDTAHGKVDIHAPCGCCCVDIHAVDDVRNVSIFPAPRGICSISQYDGMVSIANATESATITMDWVCKVGDRDVYLRVSPVDLMWISVENSVDYIVESNTNWIVN